ncbi:olfactory receptor 6M1-like [Callospermophilus lateralis]
MDAQHMEVTWYKNHQSGLVHDYRNGQEHVEQQRLEYCGRTQFLKGNISQGQVALRLQPIRTSDGGDYRCLFASSTGYGEAQFKLLVTGDLFTRVSPWTVVLAVFDVLVAISLAVIGAVLMRTTKAKETLFEELDLEEARRYAGGSGSCMDGSNLTRVTEFILLGFQNEKPVNILLFSVFLLMYLTSLVGNTLIILLVCCDRRLHSPMYFFVANLSFLQVAITSMVVPEMLANTFSLTKAISFVGCLTQSFFYFLLGSTEFFLLAVMSFDRYVAICNPLWYALIMNRQTCTALLLGSYVGAFLSILVPSVLTAPLPFCGPNVVNHFFCDSAPVLKLVCADTSLAELADFASSAVLLLGSLLLTGVSYTCIIITVLRMPSAQGRHKAFSTCASHITVVTLYYGSSIFIYVRPRKGGVMDVNKFATVLNTIVMPMLNPFIYSLRNEKVKGSLRDALAKCPSRLGTTMCPR